MSSRSGRGSMEPDLPQAPRHRVLVGTRAAIKHDATSLPRSPRLLPMEVFGLTSARVHIASDQESETSATPELDESTNPTAPSTCLAKESSTPETSSLHAIVLPCKYELCSTEHLVALISDMLVETVEANDRLQPKNAMVTLFQSS